MAKSKFFFLSFFLAIGLGAFADIVLGQEESFVMDCQKHKSMVASESFVEENFSLNQNRPLVVVQDLYGHENYSMIDIIEESPTEWAIAHSDRLTPGIYMIISTSKNDLFKKTLIIQAE